MKIITFISCLGVVCAGLAVAGEQDFTVVNKTGVEIDKLYISPASMGDWGGDVLSVDTLPAGGECDILVNRNEGTDVWDLRIVGRNDIPVEWPHLKLNDFSKITLTFENGKPVAYFE